MNTSSKLLLIFLLSVFSSSIFANSKQLLACNNCSENAKRNLVFGQNINSDTATFYVIDFKNESLDTFVLINDLEIGTRLVRKTSTPSFILTNASEYFESRQDLEDIDTNLISQIIIEQLGVPQTSSLVEATILDQLSSTNSSQGNAEACENLSYLFDYITTSSIRTASYQRALDQNPILQRLDNSFNRLVSSLNVQLTAGVVSASLIAIPTPVTVEGAGSFSVVPSPSADTFNVVSGSVVDCNGNVIPTSEEDVLGNFVFGSRENGEAFGNFVESFFGAQFDVETSSCASLDFITTCVERNNSLECTLIVPDCLR